MLFLFIEVIRIDSSRNDYVASTSKVRVHYVFTKYDISHILQFQPHVLVTLCRNEKHTWVLTILNRVYSKNL